MENLEQGARQERQGKLTLQTQSVSQTITRGLSPAIQTAAPSMVTSLNGRNGHLPPVNVEVSALIQTKSLTRPVRDGATILRTEETLVRPRNQDLKKETALQASRVLWIVSGSSGEIGVIVPRAVVLEPKREADPRKFTMKTPQTAGLGHAMVDWSAKDKLKKLMTALFSIVPIAVGGSGVSMVPVPPSALAQNKVEAEMRPCQKMQNL